MEQSKIFGIGYPKTATSSLGNALAILGYRSIHDPYEILPRFFPDDLKDFDYDASILEDHDAFIGIVFLAYKELDLAYPGSRFILTVRDEDKWLASLRSHLYPKAKATKNDSRIPLQPFVRTNLLDGDLWFIDEHAQDYVKKYQRYNQEVISYFKGRDNLLVMDIEQGDSWNKLCNFLGCSIPYEQFPWKNKKNSSWRHAGKFLKNWKRKLRSKCG